MKSKSSISPIISFIILFSHFYTYSDSKAQTTNELSRDKETVIYLIRHAEPEFPPHKNDPPNPSLNAAGKMRAEQLVDALKDAGITRIFSTEFNRTRETVQPLADRLNLVIENYNPYNLQDFAEQLRTMAGRILVVGHSNTTPELVQLLGGSAGVPIHNNREFDRLYILSLGRGRAATTVQLHYGKPASAYALRIYGVKIKVTNMDEALKFYGDIFGFEILSREQYPQLVALKDQTLPLFLELTNRPCAIEYGKTAQAIITFQTNDLKQRMAELQAKGVAFVSEIGKVGVGISIRFKDPFGNVHSLLEQTIVETPLFDEPRIYNVGFVHPEMSKAREFYCDKLGFVARTERYYPPAIPLGHSDGTFSHMLHERDGLQNAATGYPTTAQTVILYQTSEFETMLQLLRVLGVEMLHEQPQTSRLGSFIAIRDPFGVVSEVLRRDKE